MQTTFSASPRSIAIRSSRSTGRRLRAVAAILGVLVVLGVSWVLAAASVYVAAASVVVKDISV